MNNFKIKLCEMFYLILSKNGDLGTIYYDIETVTVHLKLTIPTMIHGKSKSKAKQIFEQELKKYNLDEYFEVLYKKTEYDIYFTISPKHELTNEELKKIEIIFELKGYI